MKLHLIIVCAVVGLLSACSHLGRNELKSASPRAAEIRAAMNRTVIPQVDLDNVKTEDALKFWSENSRAYDPRHFKFQHLLSYPVVYTKGTVAMSSLPERTSKVTVRRRNITSERLLDEICTQANMEWLIACGGVLVRPRSAPANTQP